LLIRPFEEISAYELRGSAGTNSLSFVVTKEKKLSGTTITHSINNFKDIGQREMLIYLPFTESGSGCSERIGGDWIVAFFSTDPAGISRFYHQKDFRDSGFTLSDIFLFPYLYL